MTYDESNPPPYHSVPNPLGGHVDPKESLLATTADPYLAYGLAAGRDGEPLKFDGKSGDWKGGMGDSAAEVPLGTKLVASMDELALVWTKWVNDKPVDRRVTLVRAGVRPPTREELGDTDQSLWATDDEGQLRDPWQATHELPLINPETGDRFVYITGSIGGINALGKLATAYSRGRARNPNADPIVALGAGGYQHKIKSRGWIHTPSLRVLGWAPRGADGGGTPQLPNDPIGF